ncbi:MAG: hypothetical protein P4L95_15065 [Rouxiella aceris]|uniref:hypothetical protein n=1 Tax=Rouxiella aceris TaxID=2703884 RepID=UPI00285124F2|nr:hypothetical protein [Rouxiella aceris]MDR3433200.1 hypothetical protein [Rouxiella aceris]
MSLLPVNASLSPPSPSTANSEKLPATLRTARQYATSAASRSPAGRGRGRRDSPRQPHNITRQSDGSLRVDYESQIVLPAYALKKGVTQDPVAQDHALSQDQQAGIFSIRHPHTATTGNPPDATAARFQVRWHDFSVQETWNKALTQQGYPPMKVVFDSKTRSWQVEPNVLLNAMAESFYRYQGGPVTDAELPDNTLLKRGQNIWVRINGRVFPIAEQKKDVVIMHPITRNSMGTPSGGQLPPAIRQESEYFIKTPVGKDMADWPPLKIVKQTGKWILMLDPSLVNTLLTVLGKARLYGIEPGPPSRQQVGADSLLQSGQNFLHITRDVSVKVGSTRLPAAIDPEGKFPPLPLQWNSADKGYDVLTELRNRGQRTLTERESWGMRLLILGMMIRNPLYGTVELVSSSLGNTAAQQRLGHFIDTGEYPDDSSLGGRIAKGLDTCLYFIFFSQSSGAATGLEIGSWLVTGLGKALLNLPMTEDEAAGALQSLLNLPTQMPAQSKHEATPALRWLESKVVDEPRLVADTRYTNLWRHQESGKQYVKQQGDTLRYRPVSEESSGHFRELFLMDPLPGEHFTSGSGGELRLMTAQELAVWQQPTEAELVARNFTPVEVINRDGSVSEEYAPISPAGIKATYHFDSAMRSFRATGKSIDAEERVVGLPGGAHPTEEERGASNLSLAQLSQSRREVVTSWVESHWYAAMTAGPSASAKLEALLSHPDRPNFTAAELHDTLRTLPINIRPEVSFRTVQAALTQALVSVSPELSTWVENHWLRNTEISVKDRLDMLFTVENKPACSALQLHAALRRLPETIRPDISLRAVQEAVTQSVLNVREGVTTWVADNWQATSVAGAAVNARLNALLAREDIPEGLTSGVLYRALRRLPENIRPEMSLGTIKNAFTLNNAQVRPEVMTWVQDHWGTTSGMLHGQLMALLACEGRPDAITGLELHNALRNLPVEQRPVIGLKTVQRALSQASANARPEVVAWVRNNWAAALTHGPSMSTRLAALLAMDNRPPGILGGELHNAIMQLPAEVKPNVMLGTVQNALTLATSRARVEVVSWVRDNWGRLTSTPELSRIDALLACPGRPAGVSAAELHYALRQLPESDRPDLSIRIVRNALAQATVKVRPEVVTWVRNQWQAFEVEGVPANSRLTALLAADGRPVGLLSPELYHALRQLLPAIRTEIDLPMVQRAFAHRTDRDGFTLPYPISRPSAAVDFTGVEYRDRTPVPSPGPLDFSGIEYRDRTPLQSPSPGLLDFSGIEYRDRNPTPSPAPEPLDFTGIEYRDRTPAPSPAPGIINLDAANNRDRTHLTHTSSANGQGQQVPAKRRRT